ncbi:tubulin epsilon and delta complex protein 2 [Cyprinodon tularosa]|uniref:tubulin epsilon and delta complex protein 2 n=1 Tax=Cyprinodon tularosa TaxID=77115 RepID=UPI0018E2174B|nr:tubulin epsilon and delta complex protein 2 [Cyprinodon tularosa]XP_038125976.1 tubulin epsilon and delta complex protein 2 [Cyprinodon tularosa]
MSLLSAVQDAIETYKVEQAKLNRSIQLFKEILNSLTPQAEEGTEVTHTKEDAAADAESSKAESEDIELLERALEKALRIRTFSEVSKQNCSRSKLSAPPKETENIPALLTVTKDVQPTIKSIKKPVSLHRKRDKKSNVSLSSKPSVVHKPGQSKNPIQRHPCLEAGAGNHQAARRLQQAVLAGSASPDQMTALQPKNKTVRSNLQRDNAQSKAVPSSVNTVSFSGTDGSGVDTLHQQSGGLSVQTTKWKLLRRKQNRLWEKVMTLQTKPDPGRSHFMQRMRATFPDNWPCGSPDETRFLLHSITDQGLSLAQLYRTEEILIKQPLETDAELLGEEQSKSPSCPTLKQLQLTAAKLHLSADKVKQEWKAWDRWRPEGGCLCPSETTGGFRDGSSSPLPITITYRTEQELQQLERLRMRVALLQQEIYLEQVLLDTLSPHLSSIRPGPGCPSPSVLRDLYSLLGEGGQRFTAIVQDSEHE